MLTRARALAIVVLLPIVALVGFSACGTGQGTQPLRLSLQVPSPVRAGETVPLTLIAKNVSGGPVELGLTGPEDTGFCRDFAVSTPDGVELWRFIDPDTMACQASLSVKTLTPGQELMLEGQWNQADAAGTPVAAGSYLVRGFLPIRLDVNTPAERGLTLQTEAKPLVILPE
jgi:hypothetical protein